MSDTYINIAVVEDSTDDLNNCLALLDRYSNEKHLKFDNIKTI